MNSDQDSYFGTYSNFGGDKGDQLLSFEIDEEYPQGH